MQECVLAWKDHLDSVRSELYKFPIEKLTGMKCILDHDPRGLRMLFLDMSFLVRLDKEQDMRL
jgi:hypothetical protein